MPCTNALASLVKGEVLSPEKIRATTGGIVPYPHQPSQTRTIPLAFRRVRVCVRLYGFASMQNSGHTRLRHPCLTRSSRCTEPLYPHNHRKIATIPLPRTKLASPRKRGGGLTALQNRYSISSSFCNLLDCFQNCYTFCRQDGGDCVCLEDLKIVLLSISIPTVTARNSFRIVKAGLSEYYTASQKKLSAVPPPLFRGEARKDCDLCYFLHNLYTFWYVIFFRCHFGRVVKP